MNLSEINLSSLDVNNIGSWPVPIRSLVIFVIFSLVVGAGYYYLINDLQIELSKAQAEEVGLRTEFEGIQSRVRNLDAYKEQLADMKQTFGALLRQLPGSTEVPELLVDISQTGLAAGLEFQLFEPQGETPKDFYAEMPIKIKVVGSYHEFGEFISGVSALPRIVTLHDIKIANGPVEQEKAPNPDRLIMDITARTYRYVDQDEEAKNAAAKADAKNSTGKSAKK